MTIYEAIGYALVIFLACVGAYTIGRLVCEGLKRTNGALDVGRLHSDAAVREYLERSIR